MDAATDAVRLDASARDRGYPDRDALIGDLRATIVRQHGPGAGDALGAVDTAVAIHSVIPDSAGSVFWDDGPHAAAHLLLSDRQAPPGARPGSVPGRAISEAIGLAAARTLRRDRSPAVAVIDSAGLSTGLAFEAINHAGNLQIPLVLVLLDAQPGRGRGVGAVPRYLTRLRGHPRYADAKALIEQGLSRMPAGEQTVEVVRRLKNAVRELLLPTAVWEELLGFVYLGPVDGHNTQRIGEILSLAVQAGRPVVMHITTEPRHRATPDRAHARPAAASTPTWLTELTRAAEREAQTDQRVVIVCGSASVRGALVRLAESFPDRFFDISRGETHATVFASRLAREGLRPIVVIGASRLLAALSPASADDRASAPITLAVAPDGPTDHADAGTDLRAALELSSLDLIVPTTAADVSSALGRAPSQHRWTLVALPRAEPAALDLPAPDRTGLRIRPGRGTVGLVATGPSVGPTWEVAAQAGRPAVGVATPGRAVARAALPPAERWLLVDDGEFGAALAAGWPAELAAVSSTIRLPAGLTLAEQREHLARHAGPGA